MKKENSKKNQPAARQRTMSSGVRLRKKAAATAQHMANLQRKLEARSEQATTPAGEQAVKNAVHRWRFEHRQHLGKPSKPGKPQTARRSIFDRPVLDLVSSPKSTPKEPTPGRALVALGNRGQIVVREIIPA